jgi:hypothetical protein
MAVHRVLDETEAARDALVAKLATAEKQNKVVFPTGSGLIGGTAASSQPEPNLSLNPNPDPTVEHVGVTMAGGLAAEPASCDEGRR